MISLHTDQAFGRFLQITNETTNVYCFRTFDALKAVVIFESVSGLALVADWFGEFEGDFTSRI